VQIFLALSAAYLLALWFALAVWAYRDINARSQSVVTQIVGTLLVVLFSIPGALLYLLLRPKETLDEAYQRSLEEEYLLQDLEEVSVCHSCKRPVEEDYMLCPHCQTMLKDACVGCGKMIDTKWTVCPYCGVNQGERAAIIREQLPQPEERFVERGAGAFAPLQPPAATITAASSQLDFGASEEFIGPVFTAPGIEPGMQMFADPFEDEESEPTEPIRLFDRRRTRALKAAGDTPSNGAASEGPDDSAPVAESPKSEPASEEEPTAPVSERA
jgi:RNA polymerase subunit RPABC4/transcription elongation factor Spt4